MWKPLVVMVAVVTILVLLVAASPDAWYVPGARRAAPASPFVRVDITLAGALKGHGSATNIGGGYYLTASHVATAVPKGTLVLVNSNGAKTTAEVLWSNETYDLALLKAEPKFASAAPLSCRTPKIGEHVTAHGNPEFLSFIDARGYVAGEPQTIGHWKQAYVVDLTVVPGMSGGAVTDDQGNVVGITVGVQLAGFGSLTGFGMAVPASSACYLLDRAA